MREQLGRGPEATADMKARIAALKESNADVIGELMERYYRAVTGEGFQYEFAGTEPVRPAS